MLQISILYLLLTTVVYGSSSCTDNHTAVSQATSGQHSTCASYLEYIERYFAQDCNSDSNLFGVDLKSDCCVTCKVTKDLVSCSEVPDNFVEGDELDVSQMASVSDCEAACIANIDCVAAGYMGGWCTQRSYYSSFTYLPFASTSFICVDTFVPTEMPTRNPTEAPSALPTEYFDCNSVPFEQNCRSEGCAWDRKTKSCVPQCEIHPNTYAVGEQISDGEFGLSDADCEKLCLDDMQCMAFVNTGECMKFSTLYSYTSGYPNMVTGLCVTPGVPSATPTMLPSASPSEFYREPCDTYTDQTMCRRAQCSWVKQTDECRESCEQVEDLLFYGNMIGTPLQLDMESCESACLANEECHFYNVYFGSCYLWSDYTDAQTQPGALGGFCVLTYIPTHKPSVGPSPEPSDGATSPSMSPSPLPTSSLPSASPTSSIPTCVPTSSDPSEVPSRSPETSAPSASPSVSPETSSPSGFPSTSPSLSLPSARPTVSPSTMPSATSPTANPSFTSPTRGPIVGTFPPTTPLPSTSPVTSEPSNSPITSEPSVSPSESPSPKPSPNDPSISPSPQPSTTPTSFPTAEPSLEPSNDPSTDPSKPPTTNPTFEPTADPSAAPTQDPSLNPTNSPSFNPTTKPSNAPTTSPSSNPTKEPSSNPTQIPSLNPTIGGQRNPTMNPTFNPTNEPSLNPTFGPTNEPSLSPTTDNPTTSRPSDMPSTATHTEYLFAADAVSSDFDAQVQTEAIAGQISEQYGGIDVKSAYAYVRDVIVDVTTSEDDATAEIAVVSAISGLVEGEVRRVNGAPLRRRLAVFTLSVYSLTRDLALDASDVAAEIQSIIPDATVTTTLGDALGYEATFLVDNSLSSVPTAQVQSYLDSMFGSEYDISVSENSFEPTFSPSKVPTDPIENAAANSTDSGGSSLGMILGLVFGCIFMCFAVAYFWYFYRTEKEVELKKVDDYIKFLPSMNIEQDSEETIDLDDTSIPPNSDAGSHRLEPFGGGAPLPMHNRMQQIQQTDDGTRQSILEQYGTPMRKIIQSDGSIRIQQRLLKRMADIEDAALEEERNEALAAIQDDMQSDISLEADMDLSAVQNGMEVADLPALHEGKTVQHYSDHASAHSDSSKRHPESTNPSGMQQLFGDNVTNCFSYGQTHVY